MDLPDSDRGDFTCRGAVDSSSCLWRWGHSPWFPCSYWNCSPLDCENSGPRGEWVSCIHFIVSGSAWPSLTSLNTKLAKIQYFVFMVVEVHESKEYNYTLLHLGGILASPGYQQLWHWACRIDRSLSSRGKDFNYLCHLNAEKMLCIHISKRKFSTTLFKSSIEFCQFSKSHSIPWRLHTAVILHHYQQISHKALFYSLAHCFLLVAIVTIIGSREVWCFCAIAISDHSCWWTVACQYCLLYDQPLSWAASNI